MGDKTVDMLNTKISHLVEKFAVHGKFKLIGSNQKRGMLFTSDYDIMTQLRGRAQTLANHFKNVMRLIPKHNYYFMDFKAGLDHRLVYDFDEDDLTSYLKNPLISQSQKNAILHATGEDRVKLIRDLFILRWKPEDITKGYVTLADGKKYTLAKALQDDTIIKLDFVIPIGNRFAEVSENYIYKQTQDDNKNIIKELANDIEKYKHKNTMKSLKRLYSIISLKNPNDSKLEKLEVLFNSEYGLMNKVANDLDLLLLLTEKHVIPFDTIMNNLQMLKENLSLTSVVAKNKILSFDKMTQRNYRAHCEKMIEYLRFKINPVAKLLLRKIG